MLTVYAIPVSLYCAKLRILLRHKRLDWQEIPPPGGYGSDDYKTIVPSGNLPALDDGGLLIGDSEAIAEYLEEKHPEPPMLPAPPADRAKVRELSRFHDTRLEPEVRKLFAQIDPSTRDTRVTVSQCQAINDRLTQLGSLVANSGSLRQLSLSLGDCGYPVTFTWIELLEPHLGLTIRWPEPILAYREHLWSLPAVSDELASYRPVLQNWLAERTAS